MSNIENNITNIDKLSLYIEELSSLVLNQTNNHFIFEEFLFRGHSDNSFKILPSIGRGRNTPADSTIFNEERNLIEMAKCKFPTIFRNDMMPIELLAILQHYGIPTRLLDVTENPLVALYFACCSDQDKDGEVLIFYNRNEHIANAPIISAVADTYKLTRGAPYILEHFLKAALNQPYFVEQLHIKEIMGDKYNGIQLIEECCSKPIFVYAPVNIYRQQMQQGRYLLFPNRIIDNYLKDHKAFDTIIDPISKEDDCIKKRIIIKKERKREILKELKICGVSDATLFYDNVDIGCKEIVESIRKRL